MASSSSAAGPSKGTPADFKPTGKALVMWELSNEIMISKGFTDVVINSYDHKNGNKTEALTTHFNMFGGCSGVRLAVSMTDLWRQTQFTDM